MRLFGERAQVEKRGSSRTEVCGPPTMRSHSEGSIENMIREMERKIRKRVILEAKRWECLKGDEGAAHQILQIRLE